MIFFFVFATNNKPILVLGPNQPPIQWAPGPVSQEVKRLEHEANHSPSP
jgi:hypothetical protein